MTCARRIAVGSVVGAWLLVVGCLAISLPIDARLRDAGRADLGLLTGEAAVFGTALLVSLVVGSILVLNDARHPVGWLFLALGSMLALTAPVDSYAYEGLLVRPGGNPGASQLAVLSGPSFLLWFGILSGILHLTPAGRPINRRWGIAAVVTGTAASLAYGLTLISPKALDDPPIDGYPNPWAVDRYGGVVEAVAHNLGLVAALGLMVSAAAVVVRFRRARGSERQQLLWLTLVIVPLPLLVVGAFVSAAANSTLGVVLCSGGFMLLIPVAACLSVLRFRLYDVDRILARATTYVLLTLLLAAVYAGTVLLAVLSLRGVGARSQIATVSATLVAVSVAAPARGRVQGAVDRRFNRRRFDALSVVREALRGAAAAREDLDEVLARALDDPSLRVAYCAAPEGRWVRADGSPAVPGDGDVTVARFGRPVASLAFDAERSDRALVESVAAEAAPELENVALRAAVTHQLVEVRESRTRLVHAQLAERRRIERNLHDGAQQRLLALAFSLRATQLRAGVDGRLQQELDAAVDELAAAVAELRALANGLHPALLMDGGLCAALEDLASRAPVPVRLEVTPARFPPAVEAAAWFVACEAVANGVKHARASRVDVCASSEGGVLRVIVRDDGVGGADPAGPGLRGITDRAEAAGGTLTVTDASAGRGTVVTLEVPCGS